MKILIIGEYSSLAKNLKSGFNKLGIETEQISYGDGWKKIPMAGTNNLLIEEGCNFGNLKIKKKEIRGSWRIFEILRFYKYFFEVKKRILNFLKNKKYDKILIINQEFIANNITHLIFNKTFVEFRDLKKTLNDKSRLYIVACGDDSVYIKYLKKYRYNPYPRGYRGKNFIKKINISNYKKILEKIDGIIPTCYDYAEPYRHSYIKEKLKPTIQFPIDLSDIKYTPNTIKEKIVIFHGLNREEFKGTKYIREAMENIKKKYPEKVEIIIDGKMPLEEYKKILERTNIVIDQCNSYSYAMNALISMAQGKVVFSGNEPECSNELGRNDIPVVNILPNVKDIEEKLEYFVNNPHLIAEIGEKSRKFVEEFHECSIVAKKYLEVMEN